MLAYRLFNLWGERTAAAAAAATASDPSPHNSSSNSSTQQLLPFLLGQHAVEALGVPLGLCIAHFITAAAPSVLAALPEQQQQQQQQPAADHRHYPASFHAAALLSALELVAFVRTALTAPGGYVLHIDATCPVGAVFFLFVWACDAHMRRGLRDAKVGLEASRRLSQAVGRAKVD